MTEILSQDLDVAAIRARFSSLAQGFAFFDAPGGSQVPDEVGAAIARALREASANLGAVYGRACGSGRSWRRQKTRRPGSWAASPTRSPSERT